jgi:hypothetical protein
MAYDSSEQQWLPTHFNLHSCESSVAALGPPLGPCPSVEALASPYQDVAYTSFWSNTNHPTLHTDNSILAYPYSISVPDLNQYYWPCWSSWYPWDVGYWLYDTQEPSTSYSLPQQEAWETTSFESCQDSLQKQPSLPYVPEGTGFRAGIVDLSFLSPDERYIVESRLENIKWKSIQAGYARHWKPMTISGLAMKLRRLRKREKILEYIVPVKSQGGLRAS